MLKCRTIGGLLSNKEQFKKLKTYKVFCSRSSGVAVPTPPFCCCSKCFKDWWERSIRDWPVGEWGMPVVWVTPQESKKAFVTVEIYAGPLSVFIWEGMPRVAKACIKCLRTSRAFSPVWQEANKAPEKVSIEEWTYFNLPNSRQCVTSVCHSCRLCNPLGLTPPAIDGKECLWQSGHTAVILDACWEVSPNCRLRPPAFWWKKEWLSLACATQSGNTCTGNVNKSARRFPSAIKLGNEVCDLTCITK